MSTAVLPATAWFAYRGRRYDLEVDSSGHSYLLTCPGCGCLSQLTHAPGEHHTLSVAGNGALTASPSLRCPSRVCSPVDGSGPCGWHVFVTDGEARDT